MQQASLPEEKKPPVAARRYKPDYEIPFMPLWRASKSEILKYRDPGDSPPERRSLTRELPLPARETAVSVLPETVKSQALLHSPASGKEVPKRRPNTLPQVKRPASEPAAKNRVQITTQVSLPQKPFSRSLKAHTLSAAREAPRLLRKPPPRKTRAFTDPPTLAGNRLFRVVSVGGSLRVRKRSSEST